MSAEGTRRRLAPGWALLIFVLVPAGLGALVGAVADGEREPVYRTSMTISLGMPLPSSGDLSEPVRDSDLSLVARQTQLAILEDPSLVIRLVESKILKADHRPECFRGRSAEDIVAELMTSIEVVPRPSTQLVDIVVQGPKPDLLPWIARQIWDQFRDMQCLLRAMMHHDLSVRAQSDRDLARAAFREAEKELEMFLATQNHTLGSLRNAVESLDDMEQHLFMSLLRIEYGGADDDGPDAAEIRARTKLTAHRQTVVERLRAAEHSLERALALDEVHERAHGLFQDAEETYARLLRLRDGPFLAGGAIVLEPIMPRDTEPEPGHGSTLVGAVAGAFLGLLLGFVVAVFRR